MALWASALELDLVPQKIGDTWRLPFTLASGNLLAPGLKIWCTVKQFADDADPGLAQVTNTSSADGVITVVDALNLLVTINASATENMPSGARLHYDVKVDENSDSAWPVFVGRIRTRQQTTVTRP